MHFTKQFNNCKDSLCPYTFLRAVVSVMVYLWIYNGSCFPETIPRGMVPTMVCINISHSNGVYNGSFLPINTPQRSDVYDGSCFPETLPRGMVPTMVCFAQKQISQRNDVYNGSFCPKTLLRGVMSMIVLHKHSPEEWSLQWFALPRNKFLREMMSIMVPFAQKHSSEEWCLWLSSINTPQRNGPYNGLLCPETNFSEQWCL